MIFRWKPGGLFDRSRGGPWRRRSISRIYTPGRAAPARRFVNDVVGPVIVDYANLERVDTAARGVHAVRARLISYSAFHRRVSADVILVR